MPSLNSQVNKQKANVQAAGSAMPLKETKTTQFFQKISPLQKSKTGVKV